MPIQRHANFSHAHFSNNISTIFDKKSGTLALIGVLSLHGIVAISLENMATPDIKPPNVTPPLEIKLYRATTCGRQACRDDGNSRAKTDKTTTQTRRKAKRKTSEKNQRKPMKNPQQAYRENG